MTNTEKTTAPELTEAQQELKEREERTSKRIQEVLEEESMALQTFLVYSEFGIASRVRLVNTKNINNARQTDSEGDAKEGGEADGASEPQQS